MIRLITLPAITLLIGVIFTDPVPRSATVTTNYPGHLTGAFTGGFGEETCRSCHFDYELNPEGGRFSVSGIPANITAADSIVIIVELERQEMGRAGFQLSARYKNGSQAGRFVIGNNDRLMFSRSTPDSLQYIQHSNKGSGLSEENKNSWRIRWQAPENPKGAIIFNVAANAANGDQSEFGDFIYAREIEVTF